MSASTTWGRGDPARRWSQAFDAALAIALAAFINLGTFFATRNQPARRPFDAGSVVLILVAALSLTARRRYPVATLFIVLASTLVYFGIGYPNGPIWLTLLLAYVTAIIRGHRLPAAVVAVLGFLLFPWLDHFIRHRPGPPALVLVALAAWLIVLLGVAEAIRIRRERAAEALRIKEEEGRRRASEERLRIARELHDSLGHYLSLINVQSGVALHLNQQLPEQVRGSLVAIKDASKEGLTELRSVLEILRQEGEPAPRTPTSTLARLDELVSQASAAGLEVQTETEGEVRQLPFGVDVAAFRIVQEALTNVTRHAGPATATVHVTYGERDLTVQVDDDGRGPSGSTAPGGGKGIVGMRERVDALGGELQAGARPGGGFRVP